MLSSRRYQTRSYLPAAGATNRLMEREAEKRQQNRARVEHENEIKEGVNRGGREQK